MGWWCERVWTTPGGETRGTIFAAAAAAARAAQRCPTQRARGSACCDCLGQSRSGFYSRPSRSSRYKKKCSSPASREILCLLLFESPRIGVYMTFVVFVLFVRRETHCLYHGRPVARSGGGGGGGPSFGLYNRHFLRFLRMTLLYCQPQNGRSVGRVHARATPHFLKGPPPPNDGTAAAGSCGVRAARPRAPRAI